MAEKRPLKQAVAEVKAAYDLPEYIRSSGVQLQAAGVGKWKACCPFHAEKTPSFSVNEHFQNYRCFGCGVSGDLLAFVTAYENLSFMEALTKLAEAKNITLGLEESGEEGVDYKSLQAVLRDSANFYCKNFQQLPEGHAAKKQVLERGLPLAPGGGFLPYGYSPSGNKLLEFLKSRGYSEEVMVQAGVCSRSKEGRVYDFFRSRLMFVITDRYGKPVGFSSRKLFEDDTRGKYVNSMDGPLFHKAQVLYNHALARKAAGASRRVFVVEGQFDVAAFVEAGLPEVVAASGTAFTRGHVEECRKMVGSGGRIVFCFDGDEAGLKAASRIFTSFPEVHEDAFVVVFPQGADPCDYRLEQGNEALVELVEATAVPLVEFMVRREKEAHDLTSMVGRSKYVAEAARLVKTISHLTLREEALRLLSLESFTPMATVREAVEAAQPLSFASEEPAPREPTPLDEEEEEEESSPVDFEELARGDKHFRQAALFVNLGLTRPAWRHSLARSRGLLPQELHKFLEEVEGLADREVLFPELFTEEAAARYLLQGDLSPFFKLMDPEELKQHFIYLHSRLQQWQERSTRERERAAVSSLLVDDTSGSLDYYRQVLARAAARGEEGAGRDE